MRTLAKNIAFSTLFASLFLSGVSAASAGFIWLAPDQAAPQASSDATAAPALPDAVSAPALAPAPAPAQVLVAPSAVVPPMAPPMADVKSPVLAAPAPELSAPSAAVKLGSDTMSSEPVYSKGDRKPAAPAALMAPASPPAAVLAMPEPAKTLQPPAGVAPVTLAPALASSPAVSSEVPLAQATIATPAVSAPTAGMPNAEALMNKLPSATAPKAVLAPAPVPMVSAPVAPVAPAIVPAPAQVVAPVTAPVATSLITGDRFGADGSVVSPASIPAAVTSPALVAPSAPVAAEPAVQGFGTKVPLVIALRQVLPAGYTFAHGDGVDLSRSVNWQGGKPWRDVLNEMLASAGLSASVTGQTVFIQKSAQQAAVAPVAAPAAMPSAVSSVRPVLGEGSMIQSVAK